MIGHLLLITIFNQVYMLEINNTTDYYYEDHFCQLKTESDDNLSSNNE